jgi:hypothetical protein
MLATMMVGSDSDDEPAVIDTDYTRYSEMIGHLKRFLKSRLEETVTLEEPAFPDKPRSIGRSPRKSSKLQDQLPLANLVRFALVNKHTEMAGKEHASLSDPSTYPVHSRVEKGTFPKPPTFAKKYYRGLPSWLRRRSRTRISPHCFTQIHGRMILR